MFLSAASNMGGRPIPGPHFVEVDLGRLCYIEKVLIDWEDGYSDSWTLEVNLKSYSAPNILQIDIYSAFLSFILHMFSLRIALLTTRTVRTDFNGIFVNDSLQIMSTTYSLNKRHVFEFYNPNSHVTLTEENFRNTD